MLASVGRKPLVPVELTRGPFTIEQAASAGIHRWHLRGASWKRIGRATYVWAGQPDGPMQRLHAALRRLPPGSAFSGRTAAWLHGIDLVPCDPIEATIPNQTGVSGRAGMAVRRRALGPKDIVRVRGIPATSIVRTLVDLSAGLSLTESLVVLDAALHLRRVKLTDLSSWATLNAGRPGAARLRRAIDLAEPAAESPMETRLRMLLVLAGLPPPGAQVSIHDSSGRFVGRPDLYYDRHRLGIEYDGGLHRDSLAEDNRRQNRLLNAGVRLLRFTAGDVFSNPDSILRQVSAMLAEPADMRASAGKSTIRAARNGASAGKCTE